MTGNKPATIFDQRDFFERDCVSKLEELEQKCQENQIPIFISAAVANIDDKTSYVFGGYRTVHVPNKDGRKDNPLRFTLETDKNGTLIYDKEKFYTEECEPIARDLVSMCTLHGVPIFISAAVASKDGKVKYISNAYMTGSSDIRLYDDKFKYYLMIAAGCKAVPWKYEQVVDMDGLSAFIEDEDYGL